MKSLFDGIYYVYRNKIGSNDDYKLVIKVLRILCQNPDAETLSKVCEEVLQGTNECENLMIGQQVYFCGWLKSKAMNIEYASVLYQFKNKRIK